MYIQMLYENLLISADLHKECCLRAKNDWCIRTLLTHDLSKSFPCLQLEYLDFTAFYELPMPKFFLFEEDDVSLLSGNNALWLDFAGRLVEANNGQGIAQTIKVTLAAFHSPISTAV